MSTNQSSWPDIQTDFTSSVCNFCRWGADVLPGQTSPAARSKEKRLYSQAAPKKVNKHETKRISGSQREGYNGLFLSPGGPIPRYRFKADSQHQFKIKLSRLLHEQEVSL